MSEWMKLYLALCLAITALVAAFQLQIDTPQPVNTGYPVSTQAPKYEWVDGCGVMHTGHVPSPWPTAIPIEDLVEVCR